MHEQIDLDLSEEKWVLVHNGTKALMYGLVKGRVSAADTYTIECFDTEQELIDRMTTLGYPYETEE